MINADEEAFLKRHAEADSGSVLRFYVIDRTNPTSIVANVHAARENARTLRPLISTEMWTQLNVFYNRVLALKPADVAAEKLSDLVRLDQARLRRPYRHHCGHLLSRRGLVLLPARHSDRVRRPDHPPARRQVPQLHGPSDQDPGSATDSFYWMALLRSAAGYQAFRRRHQRGMVPEQVATFLLSDPCFPRSVASCLGLIDEQLTALRRQYDLKAAAHALQFLDEIRDDLDVRRVQKAIANGELHRFNDFLQRSFSELTTRIATGFFGHAPVTAEVAARA